MTDKQALREKFEAWAEEAGALPWGYLKKQRTASGNYSIQIYTYMWHAWSACHEALLDELEARDKQISEMDVYRARRVSACIAACEGISTENLVNNVPIKQGLRGLNARIREADGELEALRQRIAELEARTPTVKLPDIMPPEAAPAHYWNTGESMAYADGYNKSAADLKTSFAQACSSAGVNVEFE